MEVNGKLVYKCTLREDTLAFARKELNEDPDTRLLELKAFRDRLLQYPGLRPRTDPEFLIRFLRARKWDQERAFQLVLNYYRLRKENEALFTGLKPSNLPHVWNSGIGFPHKYRDRQGRKVYFMFLGRLDLNRYTMDEFFQAEYLSISKMIQDEEDQVRGFTLIGDYTGYTMSHFIKTQSDMEASKRFIRMWQDAFPARHKATLVINEPVFMDVLMALLSPFLKEKFSRRTYRIGTDWKKLHEYIAPENLPVEYGGTLTEFPGHEDWMDTLMKSDHEMQDESKYGFVDYTIGHETKKKEQDAITNMAGTFRKLEV
ncbi:alpha-tocopherol transfer protein-like [Littorina saxatilis]|uniref:CRAL-TRIO domain-containing protein n=1 Tax=Littorina saxatilis TaxID=31220 RepID=A0AAN9AQY0_9CAEN